MQSVSHSNIVTFYGIVFQQEKELMLVSDRARLTLKLGPIYQAYPPLRLVLIDRLSGIAEGQSTMPTYLVDGPS